jgi:hypothetical protein
MYPCTNGLGRVVKTYFSKKKLRPEAVNPSKVIEQGSCYNMHIYTM